MGHRDEEKLKEKVAQALAGVKHPQLGRGLGELGMIRELSAQEGAIDVVLAVPFSDVPLIEQLTGAAREAVEGLGTGLEVAVRTVPMSRKEQATYAAGSQKGPAPVESLSRIKHVVAVMSGKGGVGKSAVAGQLAIALRRRGYSVGLLDADITGPSIPKMFGVTERPRSTPLGLQPVKTHLGISIMSINLLLADETQAVVWRGPLISSAIRQFWTDVFWGDLDYLVLDLPPGTSDATLTVMQVIPLSGAVLVTSPQELAGMVVRKSADMARQMGVRVVGVVENMSYAVCPGCGDQMEVFGPSQGASLAASLNVPFLGRLPIDPELARLCDAGQIESYSGKEFEPVADRITAELAQVEAK